MCKSVFKICSCSAPAPTKKAHRPQNLPLFGLPIFLFLEEILKFEHMIFSTLSIIIITVPSQGAELFPSAAVKISLPGHHPVELVVPRREFFWPWGGNQRQGGH